MKEFDRFYDRMLPSLYLFALVAPNGLYTSLPTYPGVLIIFCSYPLLHLLQPPAVLEPLLTCPSPDHAANSSPLTKLAQVAGVDCEQAKGVSGVSCEQAREGKRALPACSQPCHLRRTPPADSSC